MWAYHNDAPGINSSSDCQSYIYNCTKAIGLIESADLPPGLCTKGTILHILGTYYGDISLAKHYLLEAIDYNKQNCLASLNTTFDSYRALLKKTRELSELVAVSNDEMDWCNKLNCGGRTITSIHEDLRFAEAFMRDDENITFDEFWYVRDKDEYTYAINITINISNNYDVDVQEPVVGYTLNLSTPLNLYSDDEGQGILSHLSISFPDRFGGDVDLVKSNLTRLRLFFFPQLGNSLKARQSTTLNIGFEINKTDSTDKFITDTDALQNYPYVNYNRRIKVHTNDFTISDPQGATDFKPRHYEYYWSYVSNGSDANKSVRIFSHFLKPQTSLVSFYESVNVGPDYTSVERKEQRKVETKQSDITIISGLYYPSNQTGKIRVLLENEEAPLIYNKDLKTYDEMKPPQFQNGELNLSYGAYYTNESNNVRDIILVLPYDGNSISYSYSYTIDTNLIVTRAKKSGFFNDKYQKLLIYKRIYTPGKFSKNNYNYDFTFDSRYKVIDAKNISGCHTVVKDSSVTYNCEAPEFRTVDNIEITFEDSVLKQQFKDTLSRYLLLVFTGLAIIAAFRLLTAERLTDGDFYLLLFADLAALGGIFFAQDFSRIWLLAGIDAVSLLLVLWRRRYKRKESAATSRQLGKI